jgi:GH15 family glucan-1,4-alpha-glucosidase
MWPRRRTGRPLGLIGQPDRLRHRCARSSPLRALAALTGDPRVDAALLLPALCGAIPASDPRSITTVHAIASQLTEDGDCYRHRPDERPLGPSEGAFLLCGFLMTLAYAQQGDHLTAARWFERNRAACGPPGLWEEFDVTQRQLDGNLPQAFVHALLLECAVEQYPPAETQ